MTFSRPVSVLQGVLLTKELRQDCSLRPENSIDSSGQCGLPIAYSGSQIRQPTSRAWKYTRIQPSSSHTSCNELAGVLEA